MENKLGCHLYNLTHQINKLIVRETITDKKIKIKYTSIRNYWIDNSSLQSCLKHLQTKSNVLYKFI